MNTIGCILLIALFLFYSSFGLSCPSFIPARDLAMWNQGDRKNVILYRFNKKIGKIEEIPLQVEPRTVLGRHVFSSSKKIDSEKIKRTDRIYFHQNLFGNKITDFNSKKVKNNFCESEIKYEIQSIDKDRFAYLVLCKNKNRKKYAPLVKIDIQKAYVESKNYHYKFESYNHMLFDTVRIKPSPKPIANSSRLIIGNDVVNFFNLVFDSDDIVSKLEKSDMRPVGTAARVSFFLKILFLKIDLALQTDLSFFQDSAHIPMVAHLPVDAPEYLNPGSGIIYVWQSISQPKTIAMPKFSENELLSNRSRYCSAGICSFSIIYENELKQQFSLNFGIKSRLVQKGFYPKWIGKGESLDKLKWLDKNEIAKEETGVYFETSKLPKGSHKWNFWLKIGSQISSECPAKYKLKRLP